jgi:hypothetical protein
MNLALLWREGTVAVVPDDVHDKCTALLAKVEAERDALRKALLEVHGTEPSVNVTNGKPVDYCPLCDDGAWPCKVALLLDPTLKGGDQ